MFPSRARLAEPAAPSAGPPPKRADDPLDVSLERRQRADDDSIGADADLLDEATAGSGRRGSARLARHSGHPALAGAAARLHTLKKLAQAGAWR